MERITIKKSGIKPSLYRKIKHHAGGSIYHMNASGADLYTFSVKDNNWEGGWSWSMFTNTYLGDDFAINLKDGKLYKLNIA